MRRAIVLAVTMIVVGGPRSDPSAHLAFGHAGRGGAEGHEAPLEADDAPELFPPQTKVGGQLMKPKVKIGEPFQVVITVRSRTDMVVDLPASLETHPFEVLDRKDLPPVWEEAGVVRREWELTVVGWEVGETPFPSVPVSYIVKGESKQLHTDPVQVVVLETLPADRGQPDPADIAPPVPVTQPDPRVYIAIAAGAAAILLGAAAWLLVRSLRRKQAARAAIPIVDPRTPEEVALDELRALGSSGLLDGEDRRRFYFPLTEVVRAYLGRRFRFDALELTTSELLDALGRSGAPNEVVAEVSAWTAGCDLVKYAGVPASRDEALSALAQAIAIVEKARPVPQPIEPVPPQPPPPPEELRRAG
jgi:hypothetical protein